MPVFDSKLMSLDGTITVTRSISGTAIQVRGTPIKGMAARISVPSSYGTTTSILPRVWVSADGSTWYLAATYVGGAQKILKTAGGAELIVPFSAPIAKAKYAKIELVITGTTASFGKVQAGFVLGVAHDWSRAKGFGV